MNEKMHKAPFKKLLIIGMSGGLAKLTAGLLLKTYPDIEITGVDTRPLHRPGAPPIPLEKKLKFQQIRYTRGQFESLFREHDFDAIVHLGRLSHASSDRSSLSQRLDLNVMGTTRIMELALKHDIKKVVVLSTYHVYGALHDNPVYINEEHPLRASIKYPELRDVVEMDQICTNWMWKHQSDMSTVILRPCSIIGPKITNTMTQYLKASYAPVPIDFNPMFQFIHEFDMANILLRSLNELPTGTYNVAPDEVISLRESKKKMEVPVVRVPIFLLEQAARFVKVMWTFPDYLIDYIKFSCIIDNTLLKNHLGEDFCRFSVDENLELLKFDSD